MDPILNRNPGSKPWPTDGSFLADGRNAGRKGGHFCVFAGRNGERKKHLQDEMANEQFYSAGRNGERTCSLGGTNNCIARYETVYFEDEMANEQI